MRNRIISIILCIAIIVTLLCPIIVNADTNTGAKQNTVTFNENEIVKTTAITLDETSYVNLDISCNVGKSTYINKGSILKTTILDSKGNVINQDKKNDTEIYKGATLKRYAFLSKGTYTIKLERKDDSYKTQTGSVGITITQKSVTETKTGSSKKDAIEIKNGETNIFYLTNEVRQNFYKLLMPAEGEITLTYMYSSNFEGEYGKRKHSVYVMDEDGDAILYSVNPSAYNTESAITINADTRKTYYICIDGDTYISRNSKRTGSKAYGKSVLKAEWVVTDEKDPAKPKLTKCYSGSKTIKGKAEAYSTVYLTHNGKVYKKQATKKGTFKITVDKKIKINDYIKVYCKDYAGNKSKTLKLLVSPRRLSSPKQIKRKQGCTVVSGYTGAKGYTVILKVGKKTYKTTSNKNCYYKFKLKKKLYKSSKATLVIKDDCGNSSKVRKLKFK